MNRPADLARERNTLTRPGWLEQHLTHKICTRCREEKPLTDFGPRAGGATDGIHAKGRHSICRECDRKRKSAARAQTQSQ